MWHLDCIYSVWRINMSFRLYAELLSLSTVNRSAMWKGNGYVLEANFPLI